MSYVAAYGDLRKYEQWAKILVGNQLNAYSEVSIEYPPGILPFLVATESIRFPGTDFYHTFVWVMLLLDVAGFIGVLLLHRRWRSTLGAWVWIAAVPLLGPIVYLRLDLIPAVATIWAMERASVGHWGAAGGWFGFGAVAKVYPAFLILPALEVVPRYRRFLLGLVAISALFIFPFVLSGAGSDLARDVLGYHSHRGVHVESTWGFLLLLATKFGYSMYPNFQFGANEAISGVSDILKTVGSYSSLAALIVGWRAVARYVDTGALPLLAAGMFGLLSLLMFFGTVFSPQFVVWLIPLSAVALSHPLDRRLRWPLLSITLIAVLTHLVFPLTIDDVLAPFYVGRFETGSDAGLIVLGVRNFMVFLAGAATLRGLRYVHAQRTSRPALGDPRPASHGG